MTTPWTLTTTSEATALGGTLVGIAGLPGAQGDALDGGSAGTSTVIRLRRDTDADWVSVDPVLALGEPGFDIDRNALKVGDGASDWASLPYISLGLDPRYVQWSGGVAGVLPATSGTKLTTQGGNTLDDGTGKVIIKGGTLDGVTIGATTIAASVKASTLTGPSTVLNWATGAKPWLNWTGSVVGSVPSTANNYVNFIAFNDAIALSSTSQVVYGLSLTHNATTGSTGSRVGLQSHLTVSTTTAQTAAQALYVALNSRLDANVNMGGTGLTELTSSGSHWGAWIFPSLNAGATNQSFIAGIEIDLSVATGASVVNKYGLLVGLSGFDTQRGAIDDIGICFAKGNGFGGTVPGTGSFAYGIEFGTHRSAGTGAEGSNWPFASDSIIIGAGLPGTAGNPAATGLDFSNVTFSDCAIKTGPAPIQMGVMASAPATPASGKGKIYIDSGGALNYVAATSATTPGIKASALIGPASTNFGAGNKPWINYNGFVFGNVGTAVTQINSIAFNDSLVYTGTGLVYGLVFTHNVTNPAVGPRQGIYSHITANTTASQTVAQAQYVALGGRAETSINLGGTSTAETDSIGAHWSGWFFSALNSGATNQSNIFGIEIDASVASGASVSTKIGLLVALAGGDAVRGAIHDSAVCIAKGQGFTVGSVPGTWQYGLVFGTTRGAGTLNEGHNWPFASDSILIGAGLPGTAGNPAGIGIDFSSVTFSDAAIKVGAAAIGFAPMASAPSVGSNAGRLYVASDKSLHYLTSAADKKVGDVSWSGGTAGILPATSGQHLTTQGGNTLDDGAGNVVIKGGTLDAVTIGATTSAVSVKTSTLVAPTPVSLSGTMKPWLNAASFYFGNVTGLGDFNSITIQDEVVGNTNSISAFHILDNVTTPALGPRTGAWAQVRVNSAGANTATQAGYVGVYGRSETGTNLGGTGLTTSGGHTLVNNNIGSFWGGWFFGALTPGATNINSVYGIEVNTCVNAGVSVGNKIGLLIVTAGETDGGAHGILQDDALQIARQVGNSTWSNGIKFGSNLADTLTGVSNTWPFDSTSTMIGTCVLGASGNPANIGIDFSNVTFTDAAIKTGPAPIQMDAMASPPATPASGKGKLYVAADGSLHYLGPTTDTQLAPA